MSVIQPGTVIAGKYRLEQPLARGGMGAVWVARHLQLDMLVAVKLMDPQIGESLDGRARFEREARAVAQIQSPNVVRVHDYGVHDGTPYLAMELLQGEDLGARLQRLKHLPLPVVADLVAQLSRALRKAHEAGIVHRDLKPANVFLAQDDDAEVVKVLDFGVAKKIGVGEAGEATRTGVVMGSVHYMSPEQARGARDIDHRSDLWAIGVIAYRCLVGRLPFPGAQLGDVIVKICSEPLPLPSTVVPGLGPEVDAFFTRALARAPEDRFPTARDLAAALSALVDPRAALGPVGTGPHAMQPQAPAPSSGPHSAPVASGGLALPASSTGATARSGPTAAELPAPWPQASGTLTQASNATDVTPGARPGAGAGMVVVVAAVCGLSLVAAGVLFYRSAGTRGPIIAPAAEISAPNERVPVTSGAPRPSAAPSASAPPVATEPPLTTGAAPTATPTGSPTVKPAPRGGPAKVHSVLGI